MPLRPPQERMKNQIYSAWNGTPARRVVMPVLPTGGGKTRLFTHIQGEFDAHSVAIAHRQELVGQIAGALNLTRTQHSIIAPKDIVRTIVAINSMEHGHSSYNPSARASVAGIDTFLRNPGIDLKRVHLWVQDEGHHVLRENKWGKAAAMFRPDCFGLLPTASPIRADGCGLGRHADGLVDELILGPSMREMIDEGYLTDYQIVTVKDATDLTGVNVGPTGEFGGAKLRAAVHKNKRIVGDIVRTYRKHADGKLSVVFAVDLEAAGEISQAFNDAGIRSQVVSGKTPDVMRAAVLREFKAGKIRVLVNVDLFGEGFDLPAIECVIMARHTNSFSLYMQQFGRALRPMVEQHLLDRWGEFTAAERRAYIAASNKPKAMVIDHVSNWLRHNGPPDWFTAWTLNSREKRGSGAVDPERLQTACTGCSAPYSRFLAACPYCGESPIPAGRSSPEHVDGDLFLLDPEVMARILGRADKAPTIPYGATPQAAMGIYSRWNHQQQTQGQLREAIALWAGYQKHRGLGDRDAYKLFFLSYGVDVATAQTLAEADSAALLAKLTNYMDSRGVVAA